MSDEHTHTNAFVRNAGMLESYYIARAEYVLNPWLLVAAKYSHQRVTLDKSILYPALAHVVQTHAALSVRYAETPQKDDKAAPAWAWHRIAPYSLDDVVRFLTADSADIAKVLQTHLRRPEDITRADLPLWRVLVLSDATVIFAFDHAIGDGQSGIAFHLALHAALNAPSAGAPSTTTATPSTAPLTRPLEDAMDLTVSWRTLLYELTMPLNLLARWRAARTWTSRSVPSSVPATTETALHVHTLRLAPPAAARLLSVCRAHGATLTSALQTVALAALTNRGPVYTPISIPVSLRGAARTPRTAFCNHIAGHVALGAPAPFSWGRAAAAAKALRAAVPTSGEGVGMLKYAGLVGGYRGVVCGKLGKRREVAVEISNLGAFPATEGGEWAIEEMTFAQGEATAGAALKVNVVGAPSGAVGVTVTWSEVSVEERIAEEFMEAFQRGLDALVEEK